MRSLPTCPMFCADISIRAEGGEPVQFNRTFNWFYCCGKHARWGGGCMWEGHKGFVKWHDWDDLITFKGGKESYRCIAACNSLYALKFWMMDRSWRHVNRYSYIYTWSTAKIYIYILLYNFTILFYKLFELSFLVAISSSTSPSFCLQLVHWPGMLAY